MLIFAFIEIARAQCFTQTWTDTGPLDHNFAHSHRQSSYRIPEPIAIVIGTWWTTQKDEREKVSFPWQSKANRFVCFDKILPHECGLTAYKLHFDESKNQMRTLRTWYVHLDGSWMRADRYRRHPTIDSTTVVSAEHEYTMFQSILWMRPEHYCAYVTYGLCGGLNQTSIIISKLFSLFYMSLLLANRTRQWHAFYELCVNCASTNSYSIVKCTSI